MKAEAEDIVPARREMLVLLRQQMEALGYAARINRRNVEGVLRPASASVGIARKAGSHLGCDGRGDFRIGN
jgi:hypothetical protein